MSCLCEGISCACGIPCSCPDSSCACKDCKNSTNHPCSLCHLPISHTSTENVCLCFLGDSNCVNEPQNCFPSQLMPINAEINTNQSYPPYMFLPNSDGWIPDVYQYPNFFVPPPNFMPLPFSAYNGDQGQYLMQSTNGCLGPLQNSIEIPNEAGHMSTSFLNSESAGPIEELVKISNVTGNISLGDGPEEYAAPYEKSAGITITGDQGQYLMQSTNGCLGPLQNSMKIPNEAGHMMTSLLNSESAGPIEELVRISNVTGNISRGDGPKKYAAYEKLGGITITTAGISNSESENAKDTTKTKETTKCFQSRENYHREMNVIKEWLGRLM